MADGDHNVNNNNDQQRKLEAKRAYNRRLSAMKRQRTKEEITSLTAKADFESDRADKLNKKNTELMEQVRTLSVANQQLMERVQLLTAVITATIGSAAAADGIGLTSGPPLIATQNGGGGAAPASIVVGRQDLASSAFGPTGSMMGGSSSREGGRDINLRYLQLVGLLPETTTGTTTGDGRNHGSGGLDSRLLLGNNNNNSNSISSDPIEVNTTRGGGGRSILDNLLASTRRGITQQELNLLIRLNYDATGRLQNNLHYNVVVAPNASTIAAEPLDRAREGGISAMHNAAASAKYTASPSAAFDSLVRLLAIEQAVNNPSNNNREAVAAASMTDVFPVDGAQQAAWITMLANNQSLLFGTTGPRSVATAAAAAAAAAAVNPGLLSEIEAGQRQLRLLALLQEERKQAEKSAASSSTTKPGRK